MLSPELIISSSSPMALSTIHVSASTYLVGIILHLELTGWPPSFDTTKLLCMDGRTTSCLTGDQLSALNEIFSDYYEGDEFVYGRVLPSGGEAELAQGELGDAGVQLGAD